MSNETTDTTFETAASSRAVSQHDSAEYGLFWGDSMLVMPKQKEYVIEHFIRTNDVIFITATAGIGKSVLCLQMIAALTTGKPFLGEFKVPKAVNVLYVQTEGDRAETIDRIMAMQECVEFDHSKWVHYNVAGVALNTDEGFSLFFSAIEAPGINYDVVILDPLYTTLKGSMNSDEVAGDWVRNMRKLRERYDCAFVIVHHDSEKVVLAGKTPILPSKSHLMGTSVWSFFTSFNYKLRRQGDLHILECGKSRGDGMVDVLKLRMVEPSPLMYVIEDTDFTESEERILEALRTAKEPLFARQIVKETGVSRATVYRSLSKFEVKGVVKKVGVKHNTKYGYTGGSNEKAGV